jgi:hypothetical protein
LPISKENPSLASLKGRTPYSPEITITQSMTITRIVQEFDRSVHRSDQARYTFGQDVWIRAKTSISQQLAHDKADSNPEKKKSLDDLLPKAYHEYKSVFEKEASEHFP